MNESRADLSRREILAAASALIAASALPMTSSAAGDAPPKAARTASPAPTPSPSEMLSETVLVTGASGYIGGWCVVELLRRGFSVRTTVRDLSKEAALRATVASSVKADERLTVHQADLTKDEGWDAALATSDYVLHVASPLGRAATNDKESLVAPARDGTLRVLRAAIAAKVKRVVMTSAATAATPSMSQSDRVSDETTWFDPNEDVDAYRHSKRLAERAAWDFMAHQSGDMTLATVLPGAVAGPILSPESVSSAEIILRYLQGRIPANPHFGLQIVDVRDLADLHIRAMRSPDAAGQRFLGVGEFMWMSEIARTLRSRLGAAADEVPTRDMPDWLYRTFALFDSQLRALTPRLGRMQIHTAAKAKRLLQWQSRPAAETLVDCARSLIDKHLV